MTIAMGFQCNDGVVLCTDSYENDSESKRYVHKIWSWQVTGPEAWGISIASAGEADLADSFTDGLRSILEAQPFDEAKILAILRAAIRKTRLTYPDGLLAMLVAIFCRPKIHFKLYRNMDGSSHLGPVRTYQSIGIGASVANFICSQLHPRIITVEEAVRLGIFAVGRAKDHIDGCDGPTQVVSYRFGEEWWRSLGEPEIKEIESMYSASELGEAIRLYWRLHSPPSLDEQLKKYGTVQRGDEPIVLDGVKLEELYTVAGRRRTSKIFLRNTDKLQQRALLEGKRYRAAQSGASLPSDRKNRI